MARKQKSAYQQAPWRRQLQTIGLSLLPIIVIAMMISIHLVIGAQSAAAGLQIMDMHYEEEDILRTIANQRTRLAWMTSYSEMQKRAGKLGFEKIPAEDYRYMVIAGYQGADAILLADPPGSENIRVPVINEYYQQSLWDWLLDTLMVAYPKVSSGVP